MGEHCHAWKRKSDSQSTDYVYLAIFGVFMDHSMQLSLCADIHQITQSVFPLATEIG